MKVAKNISVFRPVYVKSLIEDPSTSLRMTTLGVRDDSPKVVLDDSPKVIQDDSQRSSG